MRQVASTLGRVGVAVDVFTRRDAPDRPSVETFAPGARLIHVDAGPAEALENEQLIPFIDGFAAGVEAFRADEGLSYELIPLELLALGRRRGAARPPLGGTALGDVPHAGGGEAARSARRNREPAERIAAERRLTLSVDRIVAATVHERQLLRQLYRVSPDRVSVIPLGVDLEQFQPRDRAAARSAIGIPLDERILLAVGRIEPLKGFDILIRALGEMTERERVTLLVIGGDERAAAEFERLGGIAREIGVEERVRFLGAIAHERLTDYYSAADVVVVPSFYESFGLVALEAMASCVPVVASRVGGLTSTVADGKSGYLIPWRCPEPFAEKIDLLLRNGALRAALGKAARRSMQPYAWSEVGTSLLELYESMLAGEAREVAASHRSAATEGLRSGRPAHVASDVPGR